MLVLILLLFTLNGITVHRQSSVSALDENQWIDHLFRASKFEIAHAGERIEDETVREFCIRGGLTLPSHHPPCDAKHIDAKRYGFFGGVNIAGHTPFYFLLTAPIARALRASPIDLPPDDSLVTWARLLGTVWLLIGWYLVLRIGDILTVPRRWLVVALVFLSATPALLHASTIVNPDQTALPTGAAVLLALLAWERRGRGMVWVVLAALIAAAFDPTNGLAILVGLAYLAFRVIVGATGPARGEDAGDGEDDGAGEDAPRPWRAYLTVAILMVIAGVIGNEAWNHLDAWFFTAHPVVGVDLSKNPVQQIVGLGSQGLGFTQLFGPRTIFSSFPPFDDGAIIYTKRFDSVYLTMATAAQLLAIGAMVAVALRDSIRSKIGSASFALMVGLLVSPTLYVLHDYWVGGSFYQPVARYGLSAMPFLAIVVATAARTRFSKLLLVAVTAGLYLAAIAVMFR
jgi:hypothetical protein